MFRARILFAGIVGILPAKIRISVCIPDRLGASFHRSGEVDTQRPPKELRVVHILHRCLGIASLFIFNKSESAMPLSLLLLTTTTSTPHCILERDCHVFNLTKRDKRRVQLRFIHTLFQSTDIQRPLLRHLSLSLSLLLPLFHLDTNSLPATLTQHTHSLHSHTRTHTPNNTQYRSCTSSTRVQHVTPFKIQQQTDDELFKIQQETENDLLKIQQQTDDKLFKIQQETENELLKNQQQNSSIGGFSTTNTRTRSFCTVK